MYRYLLNYGVEPDKMDNSVARQITKIEDENGTLCGRSSCNRLFPTGFKRELRGIFALAWPAALASLFITLMGIVSSMFCGQLGRKQLDGVGMAISLLNITGVSVGYGLTTACDTLFSQAFGANNKKLVGIYLQRSLLVFSLAVFICWAIHLNTEALLISIGQSRDVARIAGVYVLYFMPGLYFNFMIQILVKYLQNQNRVMPTVVFGGIGNAINVLAQYLAVNVFEKGIIGSAVGQVLSYLVMLVLVVGYIIWSGLYKETWPGWSWRALDNWDQFLHLAIAGLIMIAIEWWSLEIGVFLNGMLGEVELGATTVLFQTENGLYVIPYGISVASSIRVGHSLGAGNALAAKTTSRTVQVFAGLVFLVTGTILLSVRRVLPLLFTQDPAVVELASGLVNVLVVLTFLDYIIATSMGTLRGCGRQWAGAACNAVGYILFAVPLACVFMFVINMGAYGQERWETHIKQWVQGRLSSAGFWYGLVIGITPSAVLYLIVIMLRINWEDEVKKAQSRTSEAVALIPDKAPLIYSETDIDIKNDNISKEKALSSEAVKDYLTISRTENPLSDKMPFALLIKRLLNCGVVLCILLGGLFVRLFVPLPSEDWIAPLTAFNSTSHNNVTYNSIVFMKV